EQKAQSATSKVQEVTQEAKNVAEIIRAGSVEERLGLIEGQIGTYIAEKTSIDLLGVWKNIQVLRETKDGNSQLGETSADLLSWINRLQSDEVTVEESLPIIVEESPTIAKTLGGVEKENLKAAAMLLAMSQMRDTLSRDNASFDQDLQLLQKLVGEENPALSASIEKLAPHAQKGVLTPGGLSNEFRELAGDVVIASLSGEDVSISEKAKSRFGEIIVVEKDGEQITGTETQRAVADAQKLIDNGDIQGTIQVLQNLDGDALKTVSPFLEEAKLSLLASQVQELLGQSIQSKIRVGAMATPAAKDIIKSVNIKDIGIENVMDDMKEAVPLGGQLYEDPESGFKIYKKN
ncbi:MAG: COG4223 family protein, partial [Bdellovibrionales bacterium]